MRLLMSEDIAALESQTYAIDVKLERKADCFLKEWNWRASCHLVGVGFVEVLYRTPVEALCALADTIRHTEETHRKATLSRPTPAMAGVEI